VQSASTTTPSRDGLVWCMSTEAPCGVAPPPPLPEPVLDVLAAPEPEGPAPLAVSSLDEEQLASPSATAGTAKRTCFGFGRKKDPFMGDLVDASAAARTAAQAYAAP
jgi:hypothetical protein